MTTTRAFRILNVFTVPGDRMSGNPLCVFVGGDVVELGRGTITL